MARRRLEVGVPVCPEHPDGRVVRNGLYGRGRTGARRQRWRCTPPDGSPHNFVGAVARLVLDDEATCGSCEQHVPTYQGPAVARRYEFPVLEVALALHRVGRGMSYTEAARRARTRTARGGVPTAQLVGNWVEVFGPVVAAAHVEEDWTETVVLDSTSFHANLPGGAKGVAFTVMSAWGYEPGQQGRLVAWTAIGGRANTATWSAFLASKTAPPVLVVADGDTAIAGAVASTWPTATLRLCRWHLTRRLDGALGLARRAGAAYHELRDIGTSAFNSTADWDAFCAAADALPDPELHRWCRNLDRPLRAELTAGPLPGHWGSGALEQAQEDLRRWIGLRAFCFRNAERTNRLLELMRLHRNRVDDVARYATAIRDHLADTGQVPSRQLAIADSSGAPSLR